MWDFQAIQGGPVRLMVDISPPFCGTSEKVPTSRRDVCNMSMWSVGSGWLTGGKLESKSKAQRVEWLLLQQMEPQAVGR